MKYRALGKTGIKVSEVGFGLWTLSSVQTRTTTMQESVNLISAALDLGVNFFDTADIYAEGYCEELLATALRRRRHVAVIGAKAGYDFYSFNPLLLPGKRPQKFTADHIRYACERSLKRLGTDYIDVLQLHYPGLNVIGKDELFRDLERLTVEGKVRSWGVAAGNSPQGAEVALAVIEERRAPSAQIPFSAVDQRAGRQVFPKAAAAGAGVIVRAPLAGGLLTPSGEAVREPEEDWMQITPALPPHARKISDALTFLPRELGASLAQVAVKYALAMPSVATALPDMRSMEQVAEFTETSDKPEIPQEYLERIEEIYATYDSRGPRERPLGE
ncbi:MAG: aldo/keto reductase [SAR202 cluster bacterium]|nr:aldo/keto reductase [SAR202 cluster bacterium]